MTTIIRLIVVIGRHDFIFWQTYILAYELQRHSFNLNNEPKLDKISRKYILRRS